jgi:recombination protein RecR
LLAALPERLHPCEVCGNLASGPRCSICLDPHRQTDLICVVEGAAQIPVIERSGCFRGLYHVLGGRIEPLAGKGPGDIRVAELRRRVEAGGVRELILATSSDVEGEATAAYLAGEFESPDLQVTRIAAGVPVGADLGYADAATIAVALRSRRRLEGST